MKLLIIILTAWPAFNAIGQTLSIRGKVTDKSDGQGIVSVTVVELDKNNRIIKGVISDYDGNYFIQVKSQVL